MKIVKNIGTAMLCMALAMTTLTSCKDSGFLDINDNHKEAWHNRGYIQMFTYGDYPEAINHLTRAIQCDSTFIEAWTNRGCAYELLGDKRRAHDDFMSALMIDHTYQPAIDGLSRTK